MREGEKIVSARSLRGRSTDTERALWRRLRGRRLAGAKFRRQHALGPYIVDFICLERLLIVEVDGGQHSMQTVADDKRSQYLERLGFRVLRFWNNELLANMDGALSMIARALANPHPNPLPQAGEGARPRGRTPLSRAGEGGARRLAAGG